MGSMGDGVAEIISVTPTFEDEDNIGKINYGRI